MDRLSFSAQNEKDSFRLSFFVLHCRKRWFAQSDPKTPLSGVGGANISSRELSARSAGSSLVFRSKWKRQLQAVFFHFALSETMARTERPQVAPSRGWGCKHKFARIVRAQRGLESRFPLKRRSSPNGLLFFVLHCQKRWFAQSDPKTPLSGFTVKFRWGEYPAIISGYTPS